MKKSIILVLMLLFSSFITVMNTDLCSGSYIGQHESSSGTVYGEIVEIVDDDYYKYNNIIMEGGNDPDGNLRFIGTTSGGSSTQHTAMIFHPSYNITLNQLEVYTTPNEQYDLYVDIYLENGSFNGNWTNGTLIKDNWDPDWTTGYQSIILDTSIDLYSGETYSIKFYSLTCGWNPNRHMTIRCDNSCITDLVYGNGNIGWKQLYLDINFCQNNTHFNVTRIVSNIEKNEIVFTPSEDYFDEYFLKIPISSGVKGIIDVTNNTDDIVAIQKNNSAELVNNSFWFDSANYFVYICTENLSSGILVNWTVNCSYGANFYLNIPSFIEVGDYLIMNGLIVNDTGIPIDNVVTSTYVLFENGTVALGLNPQIKHNCVGGNYDCTISTNVLLPGLYYVAISFLDLNSSITFWYGQSFYLSYDAPPGVYSNAIVYFNFYNTNFALGLPKESLKIYVDGHRIYNNIYYTYTGKTINVTVKDYYNITLYNNNFTINNTFLFLDLGLTFHSWLFGNHNEDYYMISLLRQNGSRWWERGIIKEREFLIPSGYYIFRIYDSGNNEIYNSSTYELIGNSRVYVIEESNLTLLINGQSRIIGQLLELRSELDYALMPDALIISYNPPIIFSAFDRLGMLLGNDIWQVCPVLNVFSTTRNNTYSNSVISYPLVPTNGTVENGTISIIEDAIYLSGNSSINWVNITYTDNGTLFQNTSYIPNKINLLGQNLTINASGNIMVLRETTFSKIKKFNWTIYNSSNNPGWLSNRAGYHNAVIKIINTLNTPVYNVYVYVGFADETTPDLNTVRVRDHLNGVTLTKGENFKTSGDGLEFLISGGMDALSNRSFTCSYYKSLAYTYVYEDAQIELKYYEKNKVLNNKFYNYCEFTWINNNDLVFKGSLRIKLNFNIDPDPDTIKIYDFDNNALISNEYIISTSDFVIISGEALGSVDSGGGRTLGLYFQELLYPGLNPTEYHLNTPFAYIGVLPVTIFLIIFLASALGLILPGIIGVIYNKKQKDKYLTLIAIGFLSIFLFWIMQFKGL